MGWREEYEERQKKLIAEVDALWENGGEEQLAKRFFKNFGCINFVPADVEHELGLARTFHDFHKKLHPEMHQMTETEPYRCYHVSRCKCGFCTACDSSD